MDYSFLRKFWQVAGATVLSVFLAFGIEHFLSMHTPGAIVAALVFPEKGTPYDPAVVIAVVVISDSLFCFAILTGLYLLISRFSKRSAR